MTPKPRNALHEGLSLAELAKRQATARIPETPHSEIPPTVTDVGSLFADKINTLDEHNNDLRKQIKLLTRIGHTDINGPEVTKKFVEITKEKFAVSQFKQDWLELYRRLPTMEAVRERLKTEIDLVRQELDKAYQERVKLDTPGSDESEKIAAAKNLHAQRTYLQALTELEQELTS